MHPGKLIDLSRNAGICMLYLNEYPKFFKIGKGGALEDTQGSK
jgi:hypothetical protein